MKVLIVLSVLLAVVLGKPSAVLLEAPTTYSADSPLVTQYHSQDELGQYAYGYNGGLSSKTETRTLDGITRGSYSYIDAKGLLQTVEYTADSVNGFRVAATNLPKAPIETRKAPEQIMDTPEVILARSEHLKAFQEAKIKSEQPDSLEISAPLEPINETPEVMLARAEHLKAVEEAKLRSTIIPIAPAAPITPLLLKSSAPFGYAYNFHTPTFAYSVGSPLFPYNFQAPLNARFATPFFARSVNFPDQTPEVIKATAEHLAAVEEQKARIAAAQWNIIKKYDSM